MTAITPITAANMAPDTVNRMPALLVLGTLVAVRPGVEELVGVVAPLLLLVLLLVLLGVLLGVDALLADEAVDEEAEDEAEETEELEAADEEAADEEADDTRVDEAATEEVAEEPVRPEMLKRGEKLVWVVSWSSIISIVKSGCEARLDGGVQEKEPEFETEDAMVTPEEVVEVDPHCSSSVTVPPVVGCQLIVVG